MGRTPRSVTKNPPACAGASNDTVAAAALSAATIRLDRTVTLLSPMLQDVIELFHSARLVREEFRDLREHLAVVGRVERSARARSHSMHLCDRVADDHHRFVRER